MKIHIPSEWALYRLAEITQEITEKAGNKEYETLSISAGIGFVNQANKFGKELSGKQYEKYTVLHRGDFSYNKGNSKKYPQGCIYQLKDREVAAVPNVFESFRLTKGVDAYYEQLFVSGFLNQQLYAKINHGVRDDGLLNLKGEDFYSCYVPFPPLPEQQKIAEILTTQDKLISLQERKIEQLKELKKAYLQKMFPQKGSQYPELRFKGFTDAWEQRKLGEAVSLRGRIGFRGYTQSDLVEKGRGAITFSPADIDESGHVSQDNNKYISWEKYEESPEIKVNNGDILFTKTASVGKVGYIQELREKATINPQIALLTPLKETDGYFTFLSVTTDVFMAQVRDITGGSSVPTMSQEKLKNLTFMLPLLAEQREIASYFSNLDSLITLHQRKLEQEKQKKKALMQLLLTGKVRVKP